MNQRKLFLAFSLLLVLGLASTQIYTLVIEERPPYDVLKIFTQAFSITKSQYVEEVDQQKLIETAQRGLVDGLDGLSYFVPESEVERYRAYRGNGSLDSGLRFVRSGSFFYIYNVVPGSPADKAGIMPGDLLEGVGGKEAALLNFWEVQSALEGSDGKEVRVDVVQESREDPVEKTLHLEPYTVTLHAESVAGTVPLITLGSITPDTVRWLSERLDLAGEGDIILDVRRADGGDYESALAMASLFVKVEESVTWRNRDRVLETLSAPKEDPVFRGRANVLVDGTLAGPGELFATLIRDLDRVTLVGSSTAGLCGRQSFIPVDGGGLWLTDSVLWAGETALHVRGVRPEEAVEERSWLDAEGEKDSILEKAKEILTTNPA